MSAESTPGPGTPGESGSTSARGAAEGGRRTPLARRRKALTATAWTAAGIVVLGGAGAGFLYYKLNDNLKTVDINQALGADRPAKAATGAENILVLGSDSRAGGNEKLGGGADDGSARSDTAMIVHVDEDHKNATVVSIPRDTLVDRPECTDSRGDAHPAARDVMFNEAYSTGGAACAVKTVESLTGMRMDHYLEVDFKGFQKLVDDLGGVRISTARAIHDPNSHLDLAAGPHTLDGRQALGLVRTRHGVGDGSDLGRIQLQQAFVKALVSQVKHIGLFSDPKRLYDLADTATRTVTTDSDIGSVNRLIAFADGLKGVDSSHMSTVTMPVQYDTADANRVVVDQRKARLVWNALKADRPVPEAAREGTASGGAAGVVTSS
ncbi:LCP family protein [Streptomyces sp. NPDC046985]|uniref:LCP family protein n=1 Tax=Streptomyces sp. NPDC046985 TaxID=3155377 RepID=UPI0033CD9AFA